MLILFFLQIIHEEREARKDELMNSGFNLTRDKVLNTDYFKVMFKFTLLLSKYTATELKWRSCGSFIKFSLSMLLSSPGSICWCSWTCEIKKGLPRKCKFTNKKQDANLFRKDNNDVQVAILQKRNAFGLIFYCKSFQISSSTVIFLFLDT